MAGGTFSSFFGMTGQTQFLKVETYPRVNVYLHFAVECLRKSRSGGCTLTSSCTHECLVAWDEMWRVLTLQLSVTRRGFALVFFCSIHKTRGSRVQGKGEAG